MAKYKPLNDKQLIMLPISLDDQLVPGSLEHTISEVVDKHLDLSVFHARNQVNRYCTYDIYHARPDDCAAFPLRSRCLSQPTAQLHNLVDAMKAMVGLPARIGN